MSWPKTTLSELTTVTHNALRVSRTALRGTWPFTLERGKNIFILLKLQTCCVDVYLCAHIYPPFVLLIEHHITKRALESYFVGLVFGEIAWQCTFDREKPGRPILYALHLAVEKI